MLTFEFSGVDGSMTESEILTSGMVGKQLQLLFDNSWASLTKTVVFYARDTSRVVMDAASVVTIPEDVLARPFGKLYVGVYGTDADGTVVIPTIMVEGPMIQYGADPIEDETAKDLPVWQNLQNQIGDLTALETEAKGDLVSAVNDVQSRVNRLTGDCVGLTATAAQLLVDILSKGLYTSGQAENIDALAAELGVTVSEDPGNLILYWDFRTGSLTDRIAGLEATASGDVTMDTSGAHMPSNTSYIMFPAGLDGASLAGNVLEIKFGEMSLDESAITLRLASVCTGSQPSTAGLQWSVQDCWTRSSAVVTEFTELNMFSGKTLIVKGSADGSQLDWYFEDQLIVSSTPGFVHTHMSIGSSVGAAFPLTVEYVKIYPGA